MAEQTVYGAADSKPRASTDAPRAKVRTHHLQKWKAEGHKWAMLTAYDYSTARIFDDAGIPVLLVGDSAGFIWDMEGARRLLVPGRQSGSVTAIACASDNETIVAAWDNGTAWTWNLSDRCPVGELLRLDRHAGILSFRPGSRHVLSASEPNSLILWELPQPRRLGRPLNQGQIVSVAFSPDGRFAIPGSQNGSPYISGRMYRPG